MAKLQPTEIVGASSVSNPPDGNACIWFDSTNRLLKVTFCAFGAGTWASRNSMVNGRYGLSGLGSQNAALAISGTSVPSFTNLACVEEYNGSSWTTSGVGTVSTSRRFSSSSGTQNEGLFFGGSITANTNSGATEAYNGSNWSNRNSMGCARYGHGGAGTQNAALAFGGFNSPNNLTQTEAYNGSNWTTSGVGALSTARRLLAGAGTQNSALAFGGYTNTETGVTEAYNGSNWSSRNPLSSARLVLSGVGSQNIALAFGGLTNAALGCTESYNGSNWSSENAITNARYGMGSSGIRNQALAFGGNGNLSCTEAFTTPSSVVTCTLS